MKTIDYLIECYFLLRKFVQRELTAEDFERQFLDLPRHWEDQMDPELNDFNLDLFFYVDAYWHECTPETETDFEISEPTLRKRAHQLLRDLTRYLEARGLLPDKDPESE